MATSKKPSMIGTAPEYNPFSYYYAGERESTNSAISVWITSWFDSLAHGRDRVAIPTMPREEKFDPDRLTFYDKHSKEDELYCDAQEATVRLADVDKNKWAAMSTAFFVSPNGLLATCNHSLKNHVGLYAQNTKGEVFKVIPVCTDPDSDLAILKVYGAAAGKQFKYLEPAVNADPFVGQDVFSYGYPGFSRKLIFTKGNYLTKVFARDPQGSLAIRPILKIDQNCEKGYSGGPALNREGKVIGVMDLKYDNEPHVDGAVPVERLKPLIAKAEDTLHRQGMPVQPIHSSPDTNSLIIGSNFDLKIGLLQENSRYKTILKSLGIG